VTYDGNAAALALQEALWDEQFDAAHPDIDLATVLQDGDWEARNLYHCEVVEQGTRAAWVEVYHGPDTGAGSVWLAWYYTNVRQDEPHPGYFTGDEVAASRWLTCEDWHTVRQRVWRMLEEIGE
jgi:hypothetical protein